MSEAQSPLLAIILQLLNVEQPVEQAGQVGQVGQQQPDGYARREMPQLELRSVVNGPRRPPDPVDRLDPQNATDRWRWSPSGPAQALGPDVAANLDAAELEWRVAAMRPQVSVRGALPFLRARQDVPTGAASCWSCGERLPANRRYRCSLCARAAWIVTHSVREDVDV
jgi:hypothetical protein